MTSANIPRQTDQNASVRPDTNVQDAPGKRIEFDFTKLTPRQVSDIHRKADTDLRPESLHHTLGYSSRQAMPGDGMKRALRGLKFTGSTASYNQALFKQVLAALKSFGADDQTT